MVISFFCADTSIEEVNSISDWRGAALWSCMIAKRPLTHQVFSFNTEQLFIHHNIHFLPI